MEIHLLGIRHHGIGSALNVADRLAALQPDIVLVEGPPEFDALLKWVQPGQMEPPVAILGFNNDSPVQATFFPFAEFSPEWQAILYANQQRIPVAMIDLPLRYTFSPWYQEAHQTPERVAQHPLTVLATLDGYASGEQWWEQKFESDQRVSDAEAYFRAVLIAMESLRNAQIPSGLDRENTWREAWMRQIIRQKANEMYRCAAVVCGAWHAPALSDPAAWEARDTALLKKLPKSNISIGATWIPWTNERLGWESGYGAGIAAPGWSEHRWRFPQHTAENWLSAVAQLLRSRQMDISTAHVIDSYRLAQQLAELRTLPQPGLEELNEATVTVMCQGNQIWLDWVRTDLIVGQKMGSVPEQLPRIPMQVDFERQIKRLRLKLEPESREYRLDLRKETDLERSILLHRIHALDISWGHCTIDENAKGSFREIWILEWRPEMMLELVTKGVWGNTVQEAATNWLIDQIHKAQTLAQLTAFLEKAIPGALNDVNSVLLQRVGHMSAVSTDVVELMEIFPPLASALRYGNIRKTDKNQLQALIDGLMARMSVSLPGIGKGIDEAVASRLFELSAAVHQAVLWLDEPEWREKWLSALLRINDQSHPLLEGYATRLLFDTRTLNTGNAATRFTKALSAGYDPAHGAAWIEGFLKGSSAVLMNDPQMWYLLYDWTAHLPESDFRQLLPVLRRTFARYEPSERRRLGEKARKNASAPPETIQPIERTEAYFDPTLAMEALQEIAVLLGGPR